MHSRICLRCLARPLPAGLLLPRSGPRPFSTSQSVAASRPRDGPKPIKKILPRAHSKTRKAIPGYNKGSGKDKNKPDRRDRRDRTSTSQAPRTDPAALKAARKRLVLSNANARAVPDLEELSLSRALDPEARGTMLTLPDNVIDALRAAAVFKHSQGWGLFRRPSILCSSYTMAAAAHVDAVANPGRWQKNELESENESASAAQSEPYVTREIVTGLRGSGKSVYALQTMALAHQAGFVIMHIPDAQDMTLGHTTYVPMRTADGSIIYTQPDFTASLLSRISQANNAILSKLEVSKTHKLPIPPRTTLARLADIGAADPKISYAVFTALLAELLAPGAPPLCVSVDSVAHLTVASNYLDRDGKRIHALDLALARDLFALLSGATRMPNGGVVQAVDSRANRPRALALDMAVDAAEDPDEVRRKLPFVSPYGGPDERVLDALDGVTVRVVGGVDKSETRALLEYYARSGVFRGVVDGRRVAEEWTLASGGVVGQLERSLLRMKV